MAARITYSKTFCTGDHCGGDMLDATPRRMKELASTMGTLCEHCLAVEWLEDRAEKSFATIFPAPMEITIDGDPELSPEEIEAIKFAAHRIAERIVNQMAADLEQRAFPDSPPQGLPSHPAPPPPAPPRDWIRYK